MPSKPRLVPLVAAAPLGLSALTACGSSPSDASGEVVPRVGDQTGTTQSRLKTAGLFDNRPDRIECSPAWPGNNPDAFGRRYAGFARRAPGLAAQIRPEETAYQRIPVDAALAAQPRKTYGTWVRQGLFPGGRKLSEFIDPGLGSR
ncbi:type 2 periplasmic-binding domain-containing protein [Amycolatopsis panacis]|uniref:Uncharacterized protein n=1 Tax=Amycolatopsis panacis TaxID=2340917 RepID=A0A419I239_9PSEU|nr:hypothetical protein [Amycolatopsis panacis]RJQ83862.1 hypothetical protein D5S19_18830 [Amycolatopsis panacis]